MYNRSVRTSPVITCMHQATTWISTLNEQKCNVQTNTKTIVINLVFRIDIPYGNNIEKLCVPVCCVTDVMVWTFWHFYQNVWWSWKILFRLYITFLCCPTCPWKHICINWVFYILWFHVLGVIFHWNNYGTNDFYWGLFLMHEMVLKIYGWITLARLSIQ